MHFSKIVIVSTFQTESDGRPQKWERLKKSVKEELKGQEVKTSFFKCMKINVKPK